MGAPSGRGATRKHIIGRTRHGHGVLETHRGERRGGPGSWKNDPQSRLAPQSDDGIIAESHRQQTHTRTCIIMRALARDSVELRALASTRMRAHPAFQPIGRMCPDHLTNQRVSSPVPATAPVPKPCLQLVKKHGLHTFTHAHADSPCIIHTTVRVCLYIAVWALSCRPPSPFPSCAASATSTGDGFERPRWPKMAPRQPQKAQDGLQLRLRLQAILQSSFQLACRMPPGRPEAAQVATAPPREAPGKPKSLENEVMNRFSCFAF